MNNAPLVRVESLVKHFRLPGGWLSGGARILHAIDDVSLEIYPGQVLGLVGESGCGKTTLGRCLLRLVDPTAGRITFDGRDLFALKGAELRHLREEMQIVFQSPLSSLSPRFKVFDCVAEPLQTHRHLTRAELESRVLELLEQVGLGRQHLDRYPHELSGGQCQRVAVARALALSPRLLVLDEPTSALDVSVQAQIINLLAELRTQRGLTYLFISHDLGVVQYISDRICVMYLGKLVETGLSGAIFDAPRHPYSQALISAISVPEPGAARNRIVLKGAVPSPVNPPPGCRFHMRCPLAQARCRTEEPTLRSVAEGRMVACHFV
jgi:oligopeptide/dipeptide ABC transporter ATP-binding protein